MELFHQVLQLFCGKCDQDYHKRKHKRLQQSSAWRWSLQKRMRHRDQMGEARGKFLAQGNIRICMGMQQS